MATAYVNYLKSGDYYSNGQSLVEKEESMMTTAQAEYYLSNAAARGLSFTVETEAIEVSDDEAEDYRDFGYFVVD